MRAIGRRSRGAGGSATVQPSAGRRQVLHVGCGPPSPENLYVRFRGPEWQELRFDIDPSVQPDIVGTITDMRGVGSESVDAIWSSHNIEHVYPHDVPNVFSEFLRVLRPGGELLVTTPDLQVAAERIAAGSLEEPLYRSPSGLISPIDMLYGHLESMRRGNEFMAHRTGFTARSLTQRLGAAGFVDIRVKRVAKDHALWAAAWRP